jgi:RNA polymerase sigma-70 factor (ECF subfamily)
MAWLKDKKRASWLLVDEDLARAAGERMLALTPASAGALHAALRLCLERLRPVDRDLVLSHYEEGHSLARCAELSGRSVNALKVALFRLRAGLRRCITDRLAVEDSRLASPAPPT